MGAVDLNKKILFKYTLKIIKQWLKSSLFPVFCLDCKQEGEWWCKKCQHKNELKPFVFYPEDNYLAKSLFVFFQYSDQSVPSRLLQFWKYHFAREVEIIWQKFFDDSSLYLRNWLRFFDVNLPIGIVAVPLHKRRLRERGFNQSEIVAKLLKDKLENFGFKVCLIKDLVRKKYTRQQAKLSKEIRENNIKNAFCCPNNQIDCLQVIIADDVYTTGSTINECAKVLQEKGVKKIAGVVLAKG